MPSSLTPALLAQLEKDVAGFHGTFACEPSNRDNYAEGEMALTYTGEGEDVPVEIANEIQGEHIAAPLVRLLNAVPALVEEASIKAKLAWRGVIDPCVRCGGAGQLMYGGSATWRRGGLKAGHQPTRDVCDLCWGTGDRWRIGVDLRRMRDEEDARIAAAAMDAVATHAGVTDWNTARSLLLVRTLRDLVEPAGRKRAAIEGSAGSIVLSIAALIERSANAPTPANPPGIRPSERYRAQHQMPEAERLIRVGFSIARGFVSDEEANAAAAELEAAIAWEAKQ